jgi:catechol 2,3-dioxygenase-like lactoylglutathione lyase family enzyme
MKTGQESAPMRLQLALNVRDLDEAVTYYAKLFDTQPHKRRPGYANFAIQSPPLKLVLFEHPGAADRLNHLGVEVFEQNQVQETLQRLDQAGILSEVERETTCCHATQDKLWSEEPQGLRWEWYRITDDDPAVENTKARTGAVCCAGGNIAAPTGA